MFELNKKYKFQMVDNFTYTGVVVEENETHIKVRTIRGEDILLNKNHIGKCELAKKGVFIGDQTGEC